jgi:periplasmic protein TonB
MDKQSQLFKKFIIFQLLILAINTYIQGQNIERMPVFPGGEKKLLKFINKNLKYPASAKKDNIEGKVLVSFWVLKDGTIGYVKIAKGVRPDLDSAAITVVKKLPKFIPGTINNVPTSVWYCIPVNFILKDHP